MPLPDPSRVLLAVQHRCCQGFKTSPADAAGTAPLRVVVGVVPGGRALVDAAGEPHPSCTLSTCTDPTPPTPPGIPFKSVSAVRASPHDGRAIGAALDENADPIKAANLALKVALHMNESLLKVEVQPIKRLQLAATKPGIQRGSPHRPIAERKRCYQGRRLTRPRHAFSTPPKRRQREPQRQIHTDLAAIKRPPVDRPQRKHSVPDSARRTPLPNHPISEILNLVPSNARKTHIGERGKHPPTQIPLITASGRRLVRRPRTRTNKPRLRRRHPLLRSLANRQRLGARIVCLRTAA